MTQHINLYDPSLRITRDPLSPQSFAAVTVAALLVVLLGTVFTRWQAGRLEAPAREVASALQAQQTAIQELARQVDTLRPDTRLVAEMTAAQATLEQRQAVLKMLRAGGLGQQEGHAAALHAFARQSIDGLWLTGLVLDRRDMALRGRAMAPELIPAYVGRLNQEPALQGRSFRALDIRRPFDEPAPVKAGSPPAEPQLASYVEFSLAGANGSAVDPKEVRR